VYVPSANVGELVVPVPCAVPLPSSVDVLLENEELAVVNELPVASFRVTLVEKDPLSLVNELAEASFRVTLVENELEAAVKLPLILVAS
jgi:hypothetical protein